MHTKGNLLIFLLSQCSYYSRGRFACIYAASYKFLYLRHILPVNIPNHIGIMRTSMPSPMSLVSGLIHKAQKHPTTRESTANSIQSLLVHFLNCFISFSFEWVEAYPYPCKQHPNYLSICQ